jgi:hypothetical protein
MKLGDLEKAREISLKRKNTIPLFDRAGIYPERLHLHMDHWAENDNISGVVGGKWIGESVKARCEELVAIFDLQLKELGVEVGDE